MKTKRSLLPTYEVEFVPVERRLMDRRTRQNFCYIGIERRRKPSRHDDKQATS